MFPSSRTVLAGAVSIAIGVLSCAPSQGARSGESSLRTSDGPYSTARASRDGIGKFYMSREISFVMGHRGAAWLERPERAVEEQPDRVVEGMALAPDAVVADIGAGSGYFTFRLARVVPAGRVLAVDVQPEMLDLLERRRIETGLENVVPVLGTETDPALEEASVDAVLMVDTYHEFAFPLEMMRAVVRALRPGGRVFLVEYRAEDPEIPILPLHKMTEAQARREMEAVGLGFVENGTFLPTQHFLVFEKP
jgi:ubiquinone/menaquinone biosynthesis C-methylase UbiE